MKQITDEQIAKEAKQYVEDVPNSNVVSMVRGAFTDGEQWMRSQMEEQTDQSAEVMTLEEVFNEHSFKAYDMGPVLDFDAFSRALDIYAMPLKNRVHQLEFDNTVLNAEYESDRKHYAVIEKSNNDYVAIIDRMINSPDNVDYKSKSEALQAELDKHQWISVEDRLPETLQSVLCVLKNDAVFQLTYGELSGFFDPIYGKQVSNNNPVTHWQPLPSAPKEGGTNG